MDKALFFFLLSDSNFGQNGECEISDEKTEMKLGETVDKKLYFTSS